MSDAQRRPDGTLRGYLPFAAGVLADWQIAELAEDRGMIVPFEPKPVRSKNTCDCSCDPKEHGSAGCNTHYGDQNTGHGCGCRWKGPKLSPKVVSYGLGHYGYDMRVGTEFKVFKATSCQAVDPKRPMENEFDTIITDEFALIPPNSFALAVSVERFDIPRGVMAQVIGKSTYARCGLVVNVTPLEPEWRGYVTLEISNTTPLPARIYANEGIAQVIFHQASSQCETSYADKAGKYMNQSQHIVTPRM